MRHHILDKSIKSDLACITLGLFAESQYVELVYKNKERKKIYFDNDDDLIAFVKELQTKECSV